MVRLLVLTSAWLAASILPALSAEAGINPRPAPRELAKTDFSAIDSQARLVGRRDNLDELAAVLAGFAHGDLEKARAIFAWEAANIGYDVEAYFGDAISGEANTADMTLKRGQAVCQGYSELYKALANRMGLVCDIVGGEAKGYGFVVKGKIAGHAWNAVKIGEGWILIDATWGAGSVSEQHIYTPRFEEYFFDIDPELLAFTHCPDDPRWCLTREPTSAREFAARKYVSPWTLVGLVYAGLDEEGILPLARDGVEVPSADCAYLRSMHSAGLSARGLERIVRNGNAMPYLDDMLRLGVSEASIVRICELRKSNPDIQGTDLLAFTKIGIGEGELLKALEGDQALPYVYATFTNDPEYKPRSIRVIHAPLTESLRSGASYDFVIESEVYGKFAVLVEKTGKPEVRIPMVASGPRHSLSSSFKAGQRVTLLYNVRDEQYYGILTYLVK